MSHKIFENFSWLMPDLKPTESNSKKHIAIKGVALRGDAVSRNQRHYVDEELRSKAATLIGKPITVNHDDSHVVGHVEWAEYEDGVLEYLGFIDRRSPYADKILDQAVLEYDEYVEKYGIPPLRGVSVQANYRYNRCHECGEPFFEVELLNSHLKSVHGVDSRFTEPRGILFNALSLVEYPETPGVSDTSVQLWETAPQDGMLRLLETVASEGLKMQTISKRKPFAVSSGRDMFSSDADPLLKIREQDEPCPEGEHRDESGACVPDVAEQETPCPEGQHRDETGECVLDTVEEQEERTLQQKLDSVLAQIAAIEEPAGEAEREAQRIQLDILITQRTQLVDAIAAEKNVTEQEDEPLLLDCPEGQHRNAENVCVPDDAAVEDPISKLEPGGLLSATLKLGEPFADYPDFAACVAANSDKEDPEAYCASIEQKAEGQSVEERIQEYGDRIKLTLGLEAIREEVRVARAIGSHTIKDVASLSKGLKQESGRVDAVTLTMNEALTALYKERDKTIVYVNELAELYNKLNAKPRITRKDIDEAVRRISSGFNTRITKIKLGLVSMTELSTKVGELDGKLTEEAESVTSKLDEISNKLEELSTSFTSKLEEVSGKMDGQAETFTSKLEEVSGKVEKQSADYDKYRETVNEQYTTYKKERETQIKGLEAELKEKDEKTVKETESITTRIDNVESKLKTLKEYKAHSGDGPKPSTDTAPDERRI